MAPKLIYYGTDNSHRLSVLRAAGYFVENCRSASELVSFLESGGAEILVILFSDEERETPLEAIDIARARCSAPLIVFRDSTSHREIGFDFIIPNLTPPAEWLKDVASQIERNHRDAAQSSLHSGSDSDKVLPSDAPPSKIKRIERNSASSAAPGLRNFGPPPEQTATDPGADAGPRCLV